ncbi:MAG: hypothetical protein FD137_843 [Spirochaetes bacterium]|nr:MAG: hypothetical protein FD137_843 [Spirochaetota bacterium]
MDPVRPGIDRLLSQKLSRRSRLAALPFEEKVRMVVELQKMQEPILRARGRNVKVWSLDKVNAGSDPIPLTMLKACAMGSR